MAGIAILAGCTVQPGTGAAPAGVAAVTGNVHGGQQPVAFSTVQLYAVGTTGDGSAASPLLTQTVTTDAGGNFSFDFANAYTCPGRGPGVVYVTATGGNPAASMTNPNLVMMAVLGPCSALTPSTFISINELTTVAAVSVLAPFMSGPAAVGSASGDSGALANGFALATELVNTATGQAPGSNVPAGMVVPTALLDTLANELAACANSPGGAAGDGSACGRLFQLTTPNGGTAATNTVGALINLANNPGLNTQALFNLTTPSAPFQPQLATAPADFAVRLIPLGATPQLQILPPSLTFPDTVVGYTSTPLTVTVVNTGSAAVTVGAISVSGPNAADFAQTNNCSALAAGAACAVQVTFTPAATGARAASLSIASKAANSPLVVSLEGNGTGAVASLPSSGLLAHYLFNETAGSTLVDNSGNGNDGVITAAPQRNGVGYFFDATTENIELPAALDAANSFYFVIDTPTYIRGVYDALLPTVLSSSVYTHNGLVILAGWPEGVGAGGNYAMLATDATGNYLSLAQDYNSGTHCVALVCPAGSPGVFYIDGQPVSGYDAATGDCHNRQTSGNFRFGQSASNSGATPLGLTYFDAAFYSTVDSAATAALTCSSLTTEATQRGVQFLPPPYTSPATYLFGAGDSVTCGAKLTGGTSICDRGSVASNAWPYLAAAETTVKTYTADDFGVPGTYVQSQFASAPYTYGPLCRATAGRSMGYLFDGTNNFLTGGVTAGSVAALNFSWVPLVHGYGCRAGLVTMLSRSLLDGNGNSYDGDMLALNALLRGGWQSAGADAFVDLGSDPVFGAVGASANTTWFFDGVHPTEAGQARIAAAVACLTDASDGSNPAKMNPVAITADATMGCADGGRNIDATAGNVTYTLMSAMYMTGRQVRVCNVSATAGHAVTIAAPGDYPLNNSAGTTSVTVPQGSCANFVATFNGSTTAPGNYWQAY